MHYIGSKWVLLLHVLLVMTIMISAFVAGHEIGLGRFQDVQKATYDYAVMLEKENSRLNRRLKVCK